MIKKIQKNMNKKGFTLVELIIVLAVMAILAAIVVPRMGGITDSFKKRSDAQVCENYARAIELEIQINGVGTGSAVATAYGTVASTLATGESVEEPQTDNGINPAEAYYYVVVGNIVYVYVSDTAPNAVAAPASTLVQAKRENAKKID